MKRKNANNTNQTKTPSPNGSNSKLANKKTSTEDEKKNVLLAEQPKNQKWINWWTRTLWTIIMVLGFFFIIFSGHFYIIALVLALQILIFKEIIAIARVPSQEKKLPWFRVVNWYFLFSGVYFLYGESIITYFKTQFLRYAFLQNLVQHHRFISFSLYCLGIVMFVMSLRKGHYKFQFIQFAWTHMILLIVVFQSHFMIDNILQGIIWFLLPVSLIIINDIGAYICGFFWGRTPLIQLSPKKTWEGFIGAFFVTIIWGLGFSYILSQFYYFTCPVANLHTNILSNQSCEIAPVFIPFNVEIPWYIMKVLNVVGIHRSTISILPVQLHSIVLSIFASLIGPFGGFFASGLKRAFKIKDFGDVIPGHGGVTDRFDCQLMMSVFSYVYFQTFIKTPETTITEIMSQILAMDPSIQKEIYQQLKESLINKGQSLVN